MYFSNLRPLSFGEILDGAFTIYRRQFASLFLTALVPQLPVIAWTAIYALVGGSFNSQTAAFGGATPGLLIALAVLTLPAMIGGVTAIGGVTYQFSRAYTGTPVGTGEALRRGLSRALPLLGAYIAVTFMAMLGCLAFVVGMFVVLLAAFAVPPAVVLERLGPFDAISRSWQLIKGAWLEVFLVVFVAGLISGLPGGAVSGGLSLFGVIVSHGDMARAVPYQVTGQLLGGLLRTLTLPFSIGATVLLYYDRRVRTEALDVQMMTESLAAPGQPPYGYPQPGYPQGYGGPQGQGPAPETPRWG